MADQISPPVILHPLTTPQRWLRLEGLGPGAQLWLRRRRGAEVVEVPVSSPPYPNGLVALPSELHPLLPDDRVDARQSFPFNGVLHESRYGAAVVVSPPPTELLGLGFPLRRIACSRAVRVVGVTPGATVTLHVRDLGPPLRQEGVADSTVVFELSRPLREGDLLEAWQEIASLDGSSSASPHSTMTVEPFLFEDGPRPIELHGVSDPDQLFECDWFVRVAAVLPGARVEVQVDGTVWTALYSDHDYLIKVGPLRLGSRVRARQSLPPYVSHEANPLWSRELVVGPRPLRPPRVLPPCAGAEQVLVLDAPMGAMVALIWQNPAGAEEVLGVTSVPQGSSQCSFALEAGLPADAELWARVDHCADDMFHVESPRVRITATGLVRRPVIRVKEDLLPEPDWAEDGDDHQLAATLPARVYAGAVRIAVFDCVPGSALVVYARPAGTREWSEGHIIASLTASDDMHYVHVGRTLRSGEELMVEQRGCGGSKLRSTERRALGGGWEEPPGIGAWWCNGLR